MNAELRREKIVAAASEQLRGLLESRYVDILEACTRTFQDDGEAPDPVCKVTASIEWDALAPTAKVAVRLSLIGTSKMMNCTAGDGMMRVEGMTTGTTRTLRRPSASSPGTCR